MNVTQVSIGRFHHFHLARQMERFGILDKIITGYPKFKLKDELGIEIDKIDCFPWVHGLYMTRGKFGLDKFKTLNKEWEWLAKQSIDKYAASKINHPTVLIGLSGNSLLAGKKAKSVNGYYICDRGSSHILFQHEILKDEYQRWGFKFGGIDPRVIEKEQLEYENADCITVPSEFVRQSFIIKGVDEKKVKKIMYGARLDRFNKIAEPESSCYTLLWVGGVSIRKGFMYALHAFQKLKHPRKIFQVIGAIEVEIKQLLENELLTDVVFLGNIDNRLLREYYSKAHVFVLPSIEEGLAMVQGEAMACGCPIIATANTGSSDLLTDGKEGFIVQLRSVDEITLRLQQLADDTSLRSEMSINAIARIDNLGGWNNYGESYRNLVQSLTHIP